MATSFPAVSGGALVGGTADIAFTNGDDTGVDTDVVFLWDFDNDGDFDEPEENITTYVTGGESVSGRDWPSLLTGKAREGTLKLDLMNTDDRFSYFNALSPLNQDPFSLKTGRKIRVQTATAGSPDPVLLARDRFGTNGGLVADELGNAWIQGAGQALTKTGGKATITAASSQLVFGDEALMDLGVDDYYVQVTSEFIDDGSAAQAGIVYRYQDSDDFGRVVVRAGQLLAENIVGGVITVVASYDIDPDHHSHVTFGALLSSTSLTLYVEGVPVDTGTASATSGEVGIQLFGPSVVKYRPPAIEEFWVFDGVPAVEPEVIWTGEIADVVPDVQLGPFKTAQVTAEGRLARAANTDVTPSAAPVTGWRTGIGVGHVLSRANLNTPPGFLDEGDITTGPFAFATDNALELARQFEETELGFLRETPEGYIAFDSRSAREVVSSKAGFTDGDDAQFSYNAIRPFDWRKEILNRVSASVSPLPPGTATFTTRSASTAAGAANHIDIQMPATISKTDLILIFIASTVRTSGTRWRTPAGWTALRDPQDQQDGYTMGVYAIVAGGPNLGGQTRRFYQDTAPAGGAWLAKIVRVQDWFRSLQGVDIVDPKSVNVSLGDEVEDGSNPPSIRPRWGLYPTLFIAATAAWTSTSGIGSGTISTPPRYSSSSGTVLFGTVNGFDVGLAVGTGRIDAVDVEDPGSFGVWENPIFAEAITVAVRGPNSADPFADDFDEPSLDNGYVTVTSEDAASIDDHSGIRTNRNVPILFADTTEAADYTDRVLATYKTDRPIFEISYLANTNAGYRTQAAQRRVGDKITLTANQTVGLGVQGEFFIEQVRHRWTKACTEWHVTYQLSPA